VIVTFPVHPHVMGALLLASTVALAAGPVSAAQLTLTWQDNAGGTAAYQIERRPGATAEFGQIATTGVGATSYVDQTVPAGATVCYRVRATNDAGVSGYSNEACGTPVADPVPPAITLVFAGLLRDRVGKSAGTPRPDGLLDGTFTLTLAPGAGARTLTKLELERHDSPDPWTDVWDTEPGSPWWTLGVADFLDGPLFNGNGGVTIPLAAGEDLVLFAADVAGLFVAGSRFTLTATFADGHTATATAQVP
jgi:hypothetical protein